MIEYTSTIQRWGLLWRSENRLDGVTERLIWRGSNSEPLLFKTRKQARAYKKDHYGYIGTRKYLMAEPHGWKPVEVVKVDITIQVV